jgi:hypothetical protein
VFQNDAGGGQAVDQAQHLVGGFGGRRRVEQLRTDVAVDALDLQVRQRRGAPVDVEGLVEGNAELGGLEAGGDVGMGARVDIGIDAQRHRRAAAELASDFVELFQLAGDSTLKQWMPASSAARISSRALPTPEKTILSALPPAASTRASSPPETMSKPAPRSAKSLRMARLEFALIA